MSEKKEAVEIAEKYLGEIEQELATYKDKLLFDPTNRFLDGFITGLELGRLRLRLIITELKGPKVENV